MSVTTRSFSLADCFSLAFPRIAATLAQGSRQQFCTGNSSTSLKSTSIRCRYPQEKKLEACPPERTLDVR